MSMADLYFFKKKSLCYTLLHSGKFENRMGIIGYCSPFFSEHKALSTHTELYQIVKVYLVYGYLTRWSHNLVAGMYQLLPLHI